MALPASVALPSISSPLKIKFCLRQHWKLQRSSLLQSPRLASSRCLGRVRLGQFGEPDRAMALLSTLNEKLRVTVPDSVKEIPMRKAGNLLLERLLLLGQELVKWSLIVAFALSSLSDVVFSISRNQELIIPLGLFVGCLMTDFLKETLREVFPGAEEKGLKLQLLSIGCILIIVKSLSVYTSVKAHVLLLHTGNGGLMQVFWLWRNSFQGNQSWSESV